jgi:uncharacterized protein (TIGR04168 family)
MLGFAASRAGALTRPKPAARASPQRAVGPRASRRALPTRATMLSERAQRPDAGLGSPRPHLAPLRQGHTRVICVGDVHDQWNAVDEASLTALAPDIVIFVGDYGNENVPVVRRVAEYAGRSDAFVAAVLGNHDGFFSMSQVGRDNCPYNSRETDRVREQLDLLEPYNPAYRSVARDDGPVPLSVVGGRPLTWGGPHWKHAKFYRDYFKVRSMDQSAALIAEAATSAEHAVVLFVSHNGPTGLGKRPSDPCGKDFGERIGGDFGDSDLRDGIEAARAVGKAIPLVVFGHMHHRLQCGGARDMLKTERDGKSDQHTVMLDAAVVPRHRARSGHDGIVCQFSIVELGPSGYVDTVEQVWATSTGEITQATLLLDTGFRAVPTTAAAAPATTSKL